MHSPHKALFNTACVSEFYVHEHDLRLMLARALLAARPVRGGKIHTVVLRPCCAQICRGREGTRAATSSWPLGRWTPSLCMPAPAPATTQHIDLVADGIRAAGMQGPVGTNADEQPANGQPDNKVLHAACTCTTSSRGWHEFWRVCMPVTHFLLVCSVAVAGAITKGSQWQVAATQRLLQNAVD